MIEDLAVHARRVANALARCDVVPFLGAGANLCDRPAGAQWELGRALVPHAGELVEYLASQYDYPLETNRELTRVAQYAAVKRGTGPLYDDLREIFIRDYPTTTLHRFLATLPKTLRARGYPRRTDPIRRRFVVVTTNYDDLLEQAFAAEKEPCHVVWYQAGRKRGGRFLHRPPGGKTVEIKSSRTYDGLSVDDHAVVLKIHGTVDRGERADDSFVITEDDYIKYLSYLSRANLIPVPLPAILQERHFLFLGYSLKDWNLRVILNRIWEEQRHGWQFWAIQLHPDQVDQAFWDRRGVEIRDVPLAEYVAALAAEVERLPPAAAGAAP